MAIIEGFSYDIFISYRQKDNRYDGWVTEFVDHLTKELEATLKEEVSIYFDLNSHDGLLETHDVDASLKGKLKCLIFIPIISRTYCDPKSFAWEHELKGFLKIVETDRFGLMVKLPGGNVAGRILPVRIHELAQSDISLLEQTVGIRLRGVEFIYREPGVNKPLTPEDDERKNQNRTKYRIQINRTANAISELIEGLKTATCEPEGKEPEHEMKMPALSQKRKVNKKWSIILVSSLLLLAGLFSIFLFSGWTRLPFGKRDWIVITDFENRTGNQLFDKSLYTAFSLTTSQSRHLNVLPESRMAENLKMLGGTEMIVDEQKGREIANREGIGLVLVPSISEAGGRYVISARIIEASADSLLKSVVLYAASRDEILSVLDQLSRRIRRLLGESRYKISLQDKPLSKVTTSSLEALKIYSEGIQQNIRMEFDKARESYESALKIDTGFAAAKASLGMIVFEKSDRKQGQKLLREALRNIDRLTERERLGILAFYASAVESNLPKAIEFSKSRSDLYPDDVTAHHNTGWYYHNLKDYEHAVAEYKEVLRLNPRMVLSYAGLIWAFFDMGRLDSAIVWSEKMIRRFPSNAWGYAYKATAFSGLDSLKKSIPFFMKSRELDPDLTFNLYRYAQTSRLIGDHSMAISILNHILELDNTEFSAYLELGVNYRSMGNRNEAEKNFMKYEKSVTDSLMKDYPDVYSTYVMLAEAKAFLGESEQSVKYLEKAIRLDSARHSDFAMVLCVQGHLPEALQELELAFKSGYRDITWIKLNPDIEALRYDIRFHDLLKKYFRQTD